jgi:Tol biopolymer transport system component
MARACYWRVLLLVTGAIASGCSDDGAGPSRPLDARLAVVPRFESDVAGIVDVTAGRFVLTRIPSNQVAVDTVIAIDPTADSVSLALHVSLLAPDETFHLTIALVNAAGDTVFRAGPIEVTATTGAGTPSPIPIVLTYSGPGANAAAVTIATPDTSLFFGESAVLVAVVLDSNETPLSGTPIAWRSLDTARVKVLRPDSGRVVGGPQRGPARIVAALLTGPADTVLVTAQPAPAAIGADSGSGQTGVVGTTLPQRLVARVTAADGLGVSGVWVRFAPDPGSGSVAPDSALTDAAGRAATVWTLGPVVGSQRVAATTPRLASASAAFGATAIAGGPSQGLITFAGDSSAGLSTGVFRVNGDGTGLDRLASTTFTGNNYFYPRWAPDRSRVAFSLTSAVAGIDMLTVVSADGAETATVVSDLSTRFPRWSPDGAHLAFACGAPVQSYDQWSVCVISDVTGSVTSLAGRGNGTGKVVLTAPNRPYGVPAFAWNPTNPDQLAFVRDSAGAAALSRIYLATYSAGSWNVTPLSAEMMDAGTGPLQITSNWLDWSPDGQRLAFAATEPQSGIGHIYTIARDGTGLSQLTAGSAWDDDPRFSPDGSAILFSSDPSCALDAWMMNADGSNQHQVTAEAVCDFQTWLLGFDWSPDGQEIVLTGFDTPYNNLLIYTVKRTTTAASYFSDRVLVGRGVDAGGFVRDIQPSWRP